MSYKLSGSLTNPIITDYTRGSPSLALRELIAGTSLAKIKIRTRNHPTYGGTSLIFTKKARDQMKLAGTTTIRPVFAAIKDHHYNVDKALQSIGVLNRSDRNVFEDQLAAIVRQIEAEDPGWFLAAGPEEKDSNGKQRVQFPGMSFLVIDTKKMPKEILDMVEKDSSLKARVEKKFKDIISGVAEITIMEVVSNTMTEEAKKAADKAEKYTTMFQSFADERKTIEEVKEAANSPIVRVSHVKVSSPT